MRRLLLHSTLVLVVLLLSVAPSHAEERKPSVSVAGRRARRTKEEADQQHERGEDEEVVDEGEPEGEEQREKDFQLEAGSQTTLRNAFHSSSFKESKSPVDSKKQREMAQRVRELLSRLPIIPLSQKPMLHKETLVAAAPAVVPAVPDESATAATTPTAASHTASGLVLNDPTGPAHTVRIAAPHYLDKEALVKVTEGRMQTASPAVRATTPLYGEPAATQAFPGAFGAGEQEEYEVSEMPLRYFERQDDALETPGTADSQPEKRYPRDESRAGLHIPEAPQTGTPAEFVQLFGIMNALSSFVEWVDSVKQELSSKGSDIHREGGEEVPEEKGCEEDAAEKVSGREDIMKEQGGEEVTEEVQGRIVEGNYTTKAQFWTSSRETKQQ